MAKKYSTILIVCFSLVVILHMCSKGNQLTKLNGQTYYWKEAVSSAQFSGRFGHNVIVFNKKMWLFAGRDSIGNKNDIWFSSDGIKWIEAVHKSEFSPRIYPGVKVFKDKIWLIGGLTAEGAANDIWSSKDGIKWTQITSSAPFPERYMHSLKVYKNKLWIIGGHALGRGNNLNDVWYSSDGVNWTEAVSNADFSKRWGHGVTVFENKMWLTGGCEEGGLKGNKNDVWYSNDGINWMEAVSKADFAVRHLPGFFEYDKKLWITAGVSDRINGIDQIKNDLWYSKNGIKWTEIKTSRSYPPRWNSASVLFEDKLWLIGGTGENFFNDVWYFDFKKIH
ncbi:kelch repeat-containing protein [candidate division KSB1 bacterium]